MRIAVDLMGSDSSPQILLESALLAAQGMQPHQTLVLLVEKGALQCLTPHPRIEYLLVKETISMDENPLMAVRRKKESSIAVGLRLLAEKKVDAFVSAGNTGALMVMATMTLPKVSFVERPALLAELPSERGTVVVLDVGANLSVKPQHLVQFAELGARYQRIRHGLTCPRVGLLNIGTESQKGTAGLRAAYLELQKYCSKSPGHLSFEGNVEGSEVFQGKVDVLVTDGFTGNIFLKTTEGISAFILNYIEKTVSGAVILNELNQHLNYDSYFGAILAGLDGLVIKVHGSSSAKAFFSGIKGAICLVEEKLLDRLG